MSVLLILVAGSLISGPAEQLRSRPRIYRKRRRCFDA